MEAGGDGPGPGRPGRGGGGRWGAAVVVDRVASGERVPVGEEGHVALGPRRVTAQRSVAVGGGHGTTAEDAEKYLAVGLLGGRLFTPEPSREGGGEGERRDLNQEKETDGLQLRAAVEVEKKEAEKEEAVEKEREKVKVERGREVQEEIEEEEEEETYKG